MGGEEINILDAQKVVKNGEAVERLRKNRDFKKVFGELYFEKEPARIAKALTSWAMQDEVNQRNLEEQLRAIGHLQNFLMFIEQEGKRMQELIEESEKEEAASDVEIEYDDITGEPLTKVKD